MNLPARDLVDDDVVRRGEEVRRAPDARARASGRRTSPSPCRPSPRSRGRSRRRARRRACRRRARGSRRRRRRRRRAPTARYTSPISRPCELGMRPRQQRAPHRVRELLLLLVQAPVVDRERRLRGDRQRRVERLARDRPARVERHDRERADHLAGRRDRHDRSRSSPSRGTARAAGATPPSSLCALPASARAGGASGTAAGSAPRRTAAARVSTGDSRFHEPRVGEREARACQRARRRARPACGSRPRRRRAAPRRCARAPRASRRARGSARTTPTPRRARGRAARLRAPRRASCPSSAARVSRLLVQARVLDRDRQLRGERARAAPRRRRSRPALVSGYAASSPIASPPTTSGSATDRGDAGLARCGADASRALSSRSTSGTTTMPRPRYGPSASSSSASATTPCGPARLRAAAGCRRFPSRRYTATRSAPARTDTCSIAVASACCKRELRRRLADRSRAARASARARASPPARRRPREAPAPRARRTSSARRATLSSGSCVEHELEDADRRLAEPDAHDGGASDPFAG